MRYKVGDKVKVREWDNMAKDFYVDKKGCITCGPEVFVSDMKEYCGKIMTIESVESNGYKMEEDDGTWKWVDDMLLPVEKFSKEGLKDGMMVETAAHERYLFIEGMFRNATNGIFIEDYNSTLENCWESNYSIIKVGYPDYKTHTGFTYLLNHGFKEVIWERPSKKITKEEAMDVLKNITAKM